MTFGPRGTYANLGLPGTGLSYRTRISKPASGTGGASPQTRSTPLPDRPSQLPLLGGDADDADIRSAEVAELTTPGLGELKTLINEVSAQRRELQTRLAGARVTFAQAKRRYRRARSFIIRIFSQRAIPRLAEKVQATEHEVDVLESNLDACRVDVDFGLDSSTNASYAALVEAFDALAGCTRIWDITSSRRTDQVRERTWATNSVDRVPVEFGRSQPDTVRSGLPTLRLGNVSGREIQVFPGFLMMREASGDFGLIELTAVETRFVKTSFVESESVPPDSRVVGQTWTKANKDGSRDMRFSENRRIPIAEYGEIILGSVTGLNEVYMFSSFEKTGAFHDAFEEHQRALARLVTAPADPSPLTAWAADNESIPLPEPPSSAPSKGLWLDWIVLGLVGLTATWIIAWGSAHHAQLAGLFSDPPRSADITSPSSNLSNASQTAAKPRLAMGQWASASQISSETSSSSAADEAASDQTTTAFPSSVPTSIDLTAVMPENQPPLRLAVASALSSGFATPWKSEDGVLSGEVNVGQLYQSPGMVCRSFRYTVQSQGRAWNSADTMACLRPGGHWLKQAMNGTATARTNDDVPF